MALFLCLYSDNRLGHKGKVAMEFAWLAHNLWGGRFQSVTPRDFKNMVDSCIPAMSGNSQQDAQEFLGLLMNELHEDLNKVKEIEYIPEQEGCGSDHEQAQLAWENHIKRNNSIIVTRFQVCMCVCVCLVVVHLLYVPYNWFHFVPPLSLSLCEPCRGCIEVLLFVVHARRSQQPLNRSCTSACPFLQETLVILFR